MRIRESETTNSFVAVSLAPEPNADAPSALPSVLVSWGGVTATSLGTTDSGAWTFWLSPEATCGSGVAGSLGLTVSLTTGVGFESVTTPRGTDGAIVLFPPDEGSTTATVATFDETGYPCPPICTGTTVTTGGVSGTTTAESENVIDVVADASEPLETVYIATPVVVEVIVVVA